MKLRAVDEDLHVGSAYISLELLQVASLPLLANGASFLKYLGGMVNAAVKFCSRH